MPTISWPGTSGQLRVGQFAVDDVQVGAADGAGLDADADLARSGLRIRALFHLQRLSHVVQHHGLHRDFSSGSGSESATSAAASTASGAPEASSVGQAISPVS